MRSQMTDFESIRRYPEQRYLVLAEQQLEAALKCLFAFLRYRDEKKSDPDGFTLGVLQDVELSVVQITEILDRLKHENERQKQLGLARMAEVKRLASQVTEIFLNVIPREIASAKNEPLRLNQCREADIARYSKAGLRLHEIEKLLKPPMSDSERMAFQTRVEELEAERVRIGNWLADVPRYNPALLEGTRLECEI